MNQVFGRPVGRQGEDKTAAPKPLRPVWIHMGASVLGAMAAAIALYGVGLVLRAAFDTQSAVFLGLLTVLVAAAVAAESRGQVAPFPERAKQVPRRWLVKGETKAAASYGFVLGAAAFTLLHHASAYILGAIVLISPTPATALVIGATYGAARASPVLLSWILRLGDDGGAARFGPSLQLLGRALVPVSAFSFLATLASVGWTP